MIRGVQLVFDCTDPDEIIRFWGRALGYDLEWVHFTLEQIREARREFPQYDGRGRLDDPQGRRMPIYIQAVPEPKCGRNRVRLEVAVRDMGDALATFRELGAAEGRDGEHHDIEGNEFTLVEAEMPEGIDRRLSSIVIDARDPVSMVCFWAQATGYEQRAGRCDPPRRSDGLLDLIPGLAFVETHEPKRSKNRVHIDLHTSDAEAHQVQLRDLGATVQRWDTDHVMLDPESNEFCVS